MTIQKIVLPLIAGVMVAVSSLAQTPETPTCTKRVAPQIVFSPDPEVPESWHGHGPRQATTVLKMAVDTKGRVHNPVVVHSAGKEVDEKALEAVRRWRFKPAKCDGKPLQVVFNVEITTRLQ